MISFYMPMSTSHSSLSFVTSSSSVLLRHFDPQMKFFMFLCFSCLYRIPQYVLFQKLVKFVGKCGSKTNLVFHGSFWMSISISFPYSVLATWSTKSYICCYRKPMDAPPLRCSKCFLLLFFFGLLFVALFHIRYLSGNCSSKCE